MRYNRRIIDDVIVIEDEYGKKILSIAETPKDNSLVYILSGEVNNDVAYEMEDELVAGLSVRKSLKVDMKELTYIASSGLRSLLKVQHMIDERNGYEMILCNVNPIIKDIMVKNGFFDLFRIEE